MGKNMNFFKKIILMTFIGVMNFYSAYAMNSLRKVRTPIAVGCIVKFLKTGEQRKSHTMQHEANDGGVEKPSFCNLSTELDIHEKRVDLRRFYDAIDKGTLLDVDILAAIEAGLDLYSPLNGKMNPFLYAVHKRKPKIAKIISLYVTPTYIDLIAAEEIITRKNAQSRAFRNIYGPPTTLSDYLSEEGKDFWKA